MNFNVIKKTFSELGFSDIEAQVYIKALNPDNTISGIAEQIKVERATVYSAIKKLESNGLVVKRKTPYSRGIEVEPPSKVLTKLKKKASETMNLSSDFEQVLPDLMSSFHATDRRYQKVMFYETKEDFISVFDKILEETDEGGLFFGDAHSFINFVGVDYEKDWIRRRVDRGLSIRILVSYSPLLADIKKSDKPELRETKFLPKGFAFKSSFQVYGYKTILWNPVIPRVTIIDDPIYARMFKQIFEMLWQTSG